MVNVVGINPSPQVNATPPGPRLRPLGTCLGTHNSRSADFSTWQKELGEQLGLRPVQVVGHGRSKDLGVGLPADETEVERVEGLPKKRI